MPEEERDEGVIGRYNPNVLQGNWFAELQQRNEDNKEFLQALKSGNLIQQRTGHFYRRHSQRVRVAPEKQYITYGDDVVILNPHLKSKQPVDEPQKHTGLSVGAIFRVDDYIRSPELFPGMYLGCSGDLLPTIRNTFKISSVDNANKEGDVLRYGECFTLSPVQSYGDHRLFVESLPQHFTCPFGNLQKVRVSLVADYSVYCRWKVIHTDPRTRIAALNQPVPPNTNILITHASTNQNLCALNYWFPTVFGVECELTIETLESRFKRPLDCNVWQLHTSIMIED